MSVRIKKIIGTILILGFMIFYALVAVTIAEVKLPIRVVFYILSISCLQAFFGWFLAYSLLVGC